MAAAEETQVVETTAAEEAAVPAGAPAEAGKLVEEENPNMPAKEEKPRAPKALKEKKPRAAKPASPAHPPYFQMIQEAILAVKEKGGLSPYAIAKHMEEKYKAVLPANFRKTLLLQLKNCVAKGKLVKVKGSFKLSEVGKKDTAAEKKPAAAVKEKKPKAAATAPKPAKGKTDTEKKKRKRKAPTTSKPAVVTKAKAAKSPKVKKTRKAATVKPKQPKSIKSPAAKKVRRATAAKRARKATAA